MNDEQFDVLKKTLQGGFLGIIGLGISTIGLIPWSESLNLGNGDVVSRIILITAGAFTLALGMFVYCL